MKKTTSILTIALLIMSIQAYAGSLTVESDSQEFKDTEHKIYLEGNVKVKSGDVNIMSPHAIVDIDPKNNKVNNVEFKDKAYTYQMQDGKMHEIKAQILKMSLLNKVFTADGNTISSITEKGKPVVIVTADKQEYNKYTNVMKATGNVNIVYKDVETFSQQAIVDLTKENDVKRIQLLGNAQLNQSGSKISARKLDYDNIKQEAVATGSVFTDITTEDNKNIKVWSDYQSYNKKANYITASGSTTIKYEDYTAKGPKLNVYPDKVTKKLNEAVFIGRSKIETKGRSIEADRIVITMDPKDFKAEGNVKSIIPNIGGMN
ncbi:MAG: LptA/OstA family protein [Candidatus Avigastranaerophilus sp.]